MKFPAILFAATCLPLLPAQAQAQEGDAAAGKKVFNKCRACHDAEAEKNKVGPHLVGVAGRAAGSIEGFNYSANMKELGAGGLVWDDAKLAEYLADPKAVVPKGKMAFPGLKKEEEIANVIAYLKADPKP
ncbi:MAG: cytochrome c family protein [Rhizobiaceae bacterium]|nr:cytochrome c family protein [Rhizobiaceae bacterium]MCV0407086.1 cytochrome c family protein [Rhizobiaceae bacterium]